MSKLNESNPPDEQSGSNCWAQSLSDGETVVDLDTTSESLQDDIEEEEVDCIKTAKEVIEGVSISEIAAAIESIKMAKYNDNSAMGLVSNKMDFRDAKEERFLFDTGATACIMGEKMAKDNKIKIRKL